MKIKNPFYSLTSWLNNDHTHESKIAKVKNNDHSFPVKTSKINQAENTHWQPKITDEESAIDFINQYFHLPENIANKPDTKLSLKSLSLDNQKVTIEFNKEISSYFNEENQGKTDILMTQNELIAALNYQIRRWGKGDEIIEDENSKITIKSEDKISCLEQISRDIGAMKIIFKSENGSLIVLDSINDIYYAFKKLPPEHISHLCNIANQKHILNAYIDIYNTNQNRDKINISQRENKGTVQIEITENGYLITSHCRYQLEQIEPQRLISGSIIEIKRATCFNVNKDHTLKFDNLDKLTIKIELETNPALIKIP
ncbi:hypothetical protein GKR72_00345 [Providencia stuartii]|uniref:Uncharacterized protein n=1 Tax=Providencia stuartii ATCC 25827 TaxID=471874 RepID=A0AA87CSG8_PROST|nr:hypothetical protein [Providencia stuartii]EDU60842.1 hypothetical protein PROSTU_01379 [Providencia stuartii ATCC 25827]MTC82933.1 hypothetical protein [Providencia stuartii]MTC91523.1 hypothetical protein [Providencia stuartii]